MVVGKEATQTTKKKENDDDEEEEIYTIFIPLPLLCEFYSQKTQNDDPFPSHIVNVFSFSSFLHFLPIFFTYIFSVPIKCIFSISINFIHYTFSKVILI